MNSDLSPGPLYQKVPSELLSRNLGVLGQVHGLEYYAKGTPPGKELLERARLVLYISTFRELSKRGNVRKEEPEAARAPDFGGAFVAISQKSGLTLAPQQLSGDSCGFAQLTKRDRLPEID